MKTIEALRDAGQLQLDYATLENLMIRGQRDGEGIWGRWNANGPGTARLFHEMDLGQNFDDFAEAQPGDFMKIFWSPEVGRAEHGHSVIYLGMEKQVGPRLCPLLVEQYSDGLRRKERAAEQDRPRDFFAAGCAGEFVAVSRRRRGRQVSRQFAQFQLELRRGQGQMRVLSSGRVRLLHFLVPKLCLGTQLSAKLRFAPVCCAKRSLQDNGIPKRSLGTRLQRGLE